jgi:hypothetical protein
MTNLDKICTALGQWGFTVAKSALPQVRIPGNSTVGHLMGMIGADPNTYNIWNELGFLAEPLIQTAVTPAVNRMLAGFPDEQLPDLAMKYADAFLQQAKTKGEINLFGLSLGPDAFEGLKQILSDNLAQ